MLSVVLLGNRCSTAVEKKDSFYALFDCVDVVGMIYYKIQILMDFNISSVDAKSGFYCVQW